MFGKPKTKSKRGRLLAWKSSRALSTCGGIVKENGLIGFFLF